MRVEHFYVNACEPDAYDDMEWGRRVLARLGGEMAETHQAYQEWFRSREPEPDMTRRTRWAELPG